MRRYNEDNGGTVLLIGDIALGIAATLCALMITDMICYAISH